MKLHRILLIFITALLCVSCQHDSIENPDSIDTSTKEGGVTDTTGQSDSANDGDGSGETSKYGSIELKVNLDTEIPFSRVEAIIKNDSITIDQDLVIDGYSASRVFEDLPLSEYTAEVTLFDGDTVVATGLESIDLDMPQRMSVRIFLVYSQGSSKDSGDTSGGDETPVTPVVPDTGSFDFVGELNAFEDTFGDIRLLGEVKNNKAKGYPFVEVLCEFKGVGGVSVGSDESFVYGGCGKTVFAGTTTKTSLFPGEVGFFTMFTSIPANSVESYSCRIEYSDFAIVRPDSELTVIGDVTEVANYVDYLELSGFVKNTGTSDLIFGEVDVMVRGFQGKVISTSFSFIDGETVFLDSIKDYTDTALSIGNQASFDVRTLADVNDSASYRITGCGSDREISNAVVYKPSHPRQKLSRELVDPKERWLRRDVDTMKLRELLLRENL